MYGFSITSNIQSYAKKIEKREKDVDRATIRGVDKAAKYGVQQMKAYHRRNSKTGDLLKSIDSHKSGKYGREIGPFLDKDYPYYVEKGRGPVKAKNKDFLHFFIGKKEFFVKEVGPAKPRPFVEPTRKSMKIMFPKIMQTEIRKALK